MMKTIQPMGMAMHALYPILRRPRRASEFQASQRYKECKSANMRITQTL